METLSSLRNTCVRATPVNVIAGGWFSMSKMVYLRQNNNNDNSTQERQTA
jgi:hypothetical protein